METPKFPKILLKCLIKQCFGCLSSSKWSLGGQDFKRMTLYFRNLYHSLCLIYILCLCLRPYELRSLLSVLNSHMLCSEQFSSFLLPVQETVVSEEIMHNLDTCEVTVVGDELDGEHEGLEVDLSQLQQHGLEMSSSNLGLVICGTQPVTADTGRLVFMVSEMC